MQRAEGVVLHSHATQEQPLRLEVAARRRPMALWGVCLPLRRSETGARGARARVKCAPWYDGRVSQAVTATLVAAVTAAGLRHCDGRKDSVCFGFWLLTACGREERPRALASRGLLVSTKQHEKGSGHVDALDYSVLLRSLCGGRRGVEVWSS